jgi:predicted transcriptional regulator
MGSDDRGATTVDDTSTPPRDQEAVARFIERFASVLVEAGFPPMPARVFVTLLATDSGRRTAAELAEQLQASPAAISGAVRYLSQVELAGREREPGSRRDVYYVHDDAWYQAMARRDQLLRRWADSVRGGMEVLGPDTPAGARMAETAEYFDFVHDETSALLDRWREHRAKWRADHPPKTGR